MTIKTNERKIAPKVAAVQLSISRKLQLELAQGERSGDCGAAQT